MTHEHGHVDEPRSPVRAFVAIDLDARARRAASAILDALRGGPDARGGAVRWVRAETLHVTLRFLGDVHPERFEPLTACLRGQTAGLAPFRLELGGVHVFPTRRRPTALVLDVGPAEPLEALAEAVERGVVEAGFEPESRRFRAHLTLGRIRGQRPPVVTGDVTVVGEGCDVTEAVLFQSELAQDGAHYTPIARVPLGDGSSPLIHR